MTNIEPRNWPSHFIINTDCPNADERFNRSSHFDVELQETSLWAVVIKKFVKKRHGQRDKHACTKELRPKISSRNSKSLVRTAPRKCYENAGWRAHKLDENVSIYYETAQIPHCIRGSGLSLRCKSSIEVFTVKNNSVFVCIQKKI